MDNWKDKKGYYQEDDTYQDSYLDNDSDDENEESLESEHRLINKLDDELIEYFSEARLISKKSPKSIQKKKKEKIVYTSGQPVKASGRKGVILYGPYELDGKQMYEVEIDDNGVISVEDKHIVKI